MPLGERAATSTRTARTPSIFDLITQHPERKRPFHTAVKGTGDHFEYVFDRQQVHFVCIDDKVKVEDESKRIILVARNEGVGRWNTPREGACGFDGPMNPGSVFDPTIDDKF